MGAVKSYGWSTYIFSSGLIKLEYMVAEDSGF